MTVFRKRTRVVSFRVSEEEYEELLGLSQASGAHSVSDFARLAASHSLGETDGRGLNAMQAKMRELRGQIDQLDSEVKRLTHSGQAHDN
jgi:hypothetical protein